MRILMILAAAFIPFGLTATAQDSEKIAALKAEVTQSVDDNKKMVQEIVDSLFSFSELGFQEYETQNYISNILEENGFDVTKDVAGLPSGWWATWGNGGPVIALGTDVDGIPKASQKPGVAPRLCEEGLPLQTATLVPPPRSPHSLQGSLLYWL